MKKTLLAVAITLASSPVVFAEHQSGPTVSAMITEYDFASKRIDDSETGYSLGLGYQFDSPWGVELMYTNADTEVNGNDIDVEQFRLDGLYHLEDGRAKPYFAFGAGQMEVDSSEEPILNAGVGLKYDLVDNLMVRVDYRLIHGLYSDATDTALSLGLSYMFGQATKSASKPAPAPAPQGPVDTDGDGVVDANDSCPNTPSGIQVGSNGCERDDDNDGVVNSKDQCPTTRAGAKVDATGCYLTLEEDVTVSLEVNFANNSSVVPDAAISEIRQVADFMKQYPQTDVVIEGHTDDRGSAQYNASLSERRAKAVAQYLIENFSVSASRVSSVGYGEERPLVSNDTAENRAKNRRVSAVIKATVEKIVE